MIERHSLIKKAWQAFGICMAVLCGAFAFYISMKTQHVGDLLAKTNAEIEAKQHNIAVLQAELAYISRPETLEQWASAKGDYYTEIQHDDFVALEDIPLREGEEDQAPLLLSAKDAKPETDLKDVPTHLALKTIAITPSHKPLRLSMRATRSKRMAVADHHNKDQDQRFTDLLNALAQ